MVKDFYKQHGFWDDKTFKDALIAYTMYDFKVNHGSYRDVLNKIGLTVENINNGDAKEMYKQICKGTEDVYSSFKQFRRYGKIWLNRKRTYQNLK